MIHRCEIRVTNRGEDSNVLADRVDEITRDLLCGLCREFSCKLSDDGKTYTVSYIVEDVSGLSMKEFEEEAREMAADEDDAVSYDIRFSSEVVKWRALRGEAALSRGTRG